MPAAVEFAQWRQLDGVWQRAALDGLALESDQAKNEAEIRWIRFEEIRTLARADIRDSRVLVERVRTEFATNFGDLVCAAVPVLWTLRQVLCA